MIDEAILRSVLEACSDDRSRIADLEAKVAELAAGGAKLTTLVGELVNRVDALTTLVGELVNRVATVQLWALIVCRKYPHLRSSEQQEREFLETLESDKAKA